MGSEDFKKDGMPIMSEASAGPIVRTGKLLFAVLLTTAIAYATGHGIWKFGDTAGYQSSLHQLSSMFKNLEYLFLAGFLVSKTVFIINFYPMLFWKDKIMGFKAGNLRANMWFYKLIGEGAPDNKVVLEDAGDIGAYNRSNRSMQHFTENCGGFLILMPFVGLIFPFPAFVAACLLAVGRIMHQVGYSAKYGSHGVGFLFDKIATTILEGCALIAATHLMVSH